MAVKFSIRFRNVVLTSIAAGAGLLTLLGYFIPVPLLLAVRMQLVSWATLLAAVAVLIWRVQPGPRASAQLHELQDRRRLQPGRRARLRGPC